MIFSFFGALFISENNDIILEKSSSTLNSLKSIFLENESDESFESRIKEYENIKLFFMDNQHLILFGGGFGVSIPMIYNTGIPTKDNKMHHVHISWYLYLLRNGWAGLLLLISFWLLTFYHILKSFKLKYFDNRKIIIAVWLLISFMNMFKGNVLIGDIIVPFFSALLINSNIYFKES